IKSLKPRSSYSDDDRKKVKLNANAKHVIICALNSNEFNRVSSFATGKEMWDRLEVTYEGTNNMLVREYEMFSMKENENISSMFVRFTNIINSLQSLNKCYTNSEMVRKILRCLPKSWMPKVTAIQEAKDLNTLPLEELLGSLMTHEMTIKNHEDDEEQDKNKKKVIAFKSSTADSSEEDSDDEMALITRRFKKFLAKKKFGSKHFKKSIPSKSKTKKEECNARYFS
ncbi:UBN2 domain-containing protein, partial [Cephalotus follicularis]